jgi:hypothetical protein
MHAAALPTATPALLNPIKDITEPPITDEATPTPVATKVFFKIESFFDFYEGDMTSILFSKF